MGVQFGVWLVSIFVQYAYPNELLAPVAPLPVKLTDILARKVPALPDAAAPVMLLALPVLSVPVLPEAKEPDIGLATTPPHPLSLQAPEPQPATNHLKWLKVEQGQSSCY
jgi:hypothetical protein